MAIQPRCPLCQAQGLDKIIAKTVGHFSVVCCRQCGTIHGVVPATIPTSAGAPSSSQSSPERLKTNPEYVSDRLRPQKTKVNSRTQPKTKIKSEAQSVVLDASLEGVVSYFFEEDAA